MKDVSSSKHPFIDTAKLLLENKHLLRKQKEI